MNRDDSNSPRVGGTPLHPGGFADTLSPAGSEPGGRPAIPADGTEAFLVQLAEALHTYGTAADRLEEAMSSCARALGVEAQFLAGPTSIFVAYGAGATQRTFLVRVEPGGLELFKLEEVFDVRAQVEDGELDVVQGAARLASIRDAAPRYPAPVTALGFGLVSAGAAYFFAGGATEAATSFGLGASIGILARLLSHRRNARRLFEPVAAFWAAAVSLALAHLFPLSATIVTLSSLIMLIPGLTLTIAVSELATGHLVSGTARLAGALTVFLTIAFGVAIGRESSGLLYGGLPPDGVPVPFPDWMQWAALGVASLAFTVVLQARLSQLPWILATGVGGFLASKLGTEHFGPQLGVFLGALTVGLAANLYSRLLRRPGAVVRVPGILLLVPGSIGYQSLGFFLVQDVTSGMEAAFRTAIVAVALVGGLLAANVFLPAGRTL